ncbi:hypothetical protein H4S08_000487 [Coemansia sp. RSA 1365]|nr:hypothetical protein H4S08_000487 [Coemansia sp. RSA 1365]
MHNFRPTTFLSPTYCELCGGFLWGLSRQGVRCRRCHTTAHRDCASETVTKCTGDRGLATLVQGTDGRSGSSKGTVTTYTRDEQEHTQRGRDNYRDRLDSMFWEQVSEESRLNDMVSHQAEQPLSLFQTLPANFMQFTAKLAPLSLVLHGITDIVFWRRPRSTVVAMCVYSMYCLRPNLLLATPLALMIAYIVFGYFNSGNYQQDMRAVGAVPLNGHQREPSADAQAKPRRLGSGIFGIMPLGGRRPSSAQASTAPPPPVNRQQRNRPREQICDQAAGPYPQINTSAWGSTSQRLNDATTAPPEQALSDDNGLRLGTSAGAAKQPLSNGHQRSHSSNSAYLVSNRTQDIPNAIVSAPTSPNPTTLTKTESDLGVMGISSGAGGKGSIDLGAMLGVVSFGSAKYTMNVHTTQTMTGGYVAMYDWVATHNYLVDWSHPTEARRILTACIYAQLVVLVVVYWVPWYLLFLIGGNVGMLLLSPHVRAFGKIYGVEVALYLHEWILDQPERFRRRLMGLLVARWAVALIKTFVCRHKRSNVSSSCRGGRATRSTTEFGLPRRLDQDSSDDDESDDSADEAASSGYLTPPLLTSTPLRRTRVVGVFENQRWWLAFGWIPRLGSNERAKWSDESGQRSFGSIKDFMPEDGFEWADEDGEWEIDKNWALPVRTDEDGWVYTDNFWRHPAPAPSAVRSYTRRRRWIRRVRPINRAGSSRATNIS